MIDTRCPVGKYQDEEGQTECKTKTKCGLGQGDDLSLGFNLTNTPLGMDWTYGVMEGIENSCSLIKNYFPSFGEEDCTVFLAIIMEYAYDEIANDMLGGVEIMYSNNGSLIELVKQDYADPSGTIDGQFIFGCLYASAFFPQNPEITTLLQLVLILLLRVRL